MPEFFWSVSSDDNTKAELLPIAKLAGPAEIWVVPLQDAGPTRKIHIAWFFFLGNKTWAKVLNPRWMQLIHQLILIPLCKPISAFVAFFSFKLVYDNLSQLCLLTLSDFLHWLAGILWRQCSF